MVVYNRKKKNLIKFQNIAHDYFNIIIIMVKSEALNPLHL